MQECAVICGMLIGPEPRSFFERHVAAVGILVLAAIFFFGLFEAAVLRQRGPAIATWFWGITVLSLWIGVPFTRLRTLAAGAVFVIGVALLIALNRILPGRKDG